MASPDFPLSDVFGSLTAEPVVTSNAKVVHSNQAESNSGDVGEADIHNDMVPPALSEVRQNMLHTQFDNLVQKLPEVKHVSIPDNERS